jgi:hypothetical protein
VVDLLDTGNSCEEGRCPTRLGPADVEAVCAAGHDERAVDLLVCVTAVCTMSHRNVQGCGRTTPHPAGLHAAVERLHCQGDAGTVPYIGAQAEHASTLCDREA